MTEKTLFTIEEFKKETGIGTNRAYQFAHESGCGIRIGKRIFIHRESFEEWCRKHLEP